MSAVRQGNGKEGGGEGEGVDGCGSGAEEVIAEKTEVDGVFV